jgi:Ca2+-binding EF-hand superfamily protein
MTPCTRILIALPLLLGLSAQARGQAEDFAAPLFGPTEPAAVKAKPAPKPDYVEGLFLASDRPVLVRLHIQVGGRPYYAAWDDYMNKLFDHFDVKRQGYLTKEQAERAPNANIIQQLLQGSIGFGRGQTARMADMDTNKDGKVSRDEFLEYYRRSGFNPLRLGIGRNDARTQRITDSLYRFLDTDKSGKLTADKFAKAENLLAHLDENEDELISREELLPDQVNNPYFGAPVEFSGGPGGRRPQRPSFVQINPGQPVGPLVQQLLAQYDKDKNGKLSREEIGLPKADFDALDTNKDGHLDAKELEAFFRRPIDLEMIARPGVAGRPVIRGQGTIEQAVREISTFLGYRFSLARHIDLVSTRGKPTPLASAAKRYDESAMDLVLGDARIEITVTPDANGAGRFSGSKQFYLQQFDLADTEKKGVIERKQAMMTDFLIDMFVYADRNGTGKLTRKELVAWLDLLGEGSGCFVVFNFTEIGRDLFEVLDVNKDNQLSIRELRTAWSRVKALSKDGTGLAKDDIPRRFQVTISQGYNFRGRGVTVRTGPNQARPRGPLWFRKMDKNGDGDVSRKEFLGTEEQFREIDTDGDGLISAAEAERYEAKLKKQQAAEKKGEKAPK